MMNRILVKEIQVLQEKLTNVESNAKKAYEENEKKGTEYISAKSDHQKLSRHIGKIRNSQDIKIANLDSNIEKLEIKVALLREELTSLETVCKDDAFEFSKLKEELPELKIANQKRIIAMKEELRQAKEDLQDQCEMDLELERAHEKNIKKAMSNYKEKLKSAEKSLLERYKKAKMKYTAKAEPLLSRIEFLDAEIRKIEDKILSKPKELEILKIQNERLVRKYEKASACRVLHDSQLTVRSLEDALKYLEKQPENVTDDVLLGILIAKANLQWIINRLKHYISTSSRTNEVLESLLKQCSNIVELKKNYSSFSLLKENLWKAEAENLKYGHLNQYDDEFTLPKFDSCQSIDTYMMKGTPEESDFCINELLSSNCQISEHCWLSEINGDSHSGYKTTHRLLYFQILVKMKCEEIDPTKFSEVREIKKKLCQQILLEAKALFEKSSLSVTRDLFMEQIALCGWEGYEEFSPDIWRNQVRNWQNGNGCFGLGKEFKNCTADAFEKKMTKRKGSATDDCHAHVTGVAVPTLAFFLRVTLKMAFNLPENPNFILAV